MTPFVDLVLTNQHHDHGQHLNDVIVHHRWRHDFLDAQTLNEVIKHFQEALVLCLPHVFFRF
ncbi:MAG TPA: hypothetical protein VFO16_06090 [Pseudonocardiaceae bacterium]|nr:hypothetical protein [Pseudonocardiaceae bacterium]